MSSRVYQGWFRSIIRSACNQADGLSPLKAHSFATGRSETLWMSGWTFSLQGTENIYISHLMLQIRIIILPNVANMEMGQAVPYTQVHWWVGKAAGHHSCRWGLHEAHQLNNRWAALHLHVHSFAPLQDILLMSFSVRRSHFPLFWWRIITFPSPLQIIIIYTVFLICCTMSFSSFARILLLSACFDHSGLWISKGSALMHVSRLSGWWRDSAPKASSG